jgi:hypothetical protein
MREPDEELINAAIDRLIAICRASVSSSTGPVRVFGEMVGLLHKSSLDATISSNRCGTPVIQVIGRQVSFR